MNVSVTEIYDILPTEVLQNVKSLYVWLSGQLPAPWNNIIPFFYPFYTLPHVRCTVNLISWPREVVPQSSSEECFMRVDAQVCPCLPVFECKYPACFTSIYSGPVLSQTNGSVDNKISLGTISLRCSGFKYSLEAGKVSFTREMGNGTRSVSHVLRVKRRDSGRINFMHGLRGTPAQNSVL